MPPIAQGRFDDNSDQNDIAMRRPRQENTPRTVVTTSDTVVSTTRSRMNEYQPEFDSENSSARSLYKSDHSSHEPIRNSVETSSLTGFYSSRRSLVSLPEEERRIDLARQQQQEQYVSPKKDKIQPIKQDTSPRKPRRNSIDTITHPSDDQVRCEETIPRRSSVDSFRWKQSTNPLTSIDIAPRQPVNRRLSFDREMSKEEVLYDSTARQQKTSDLDFSPKKPIKQKSFDLSISPAPSNEEMEIYFSFTNTTSSTTNSTTNSTPTSGDAKNDDSTPKQPQKRISLSDHSSTESREIHFSPAPVVAAAVAPVATAETRVTQQKNRKKEIIVELPVEGLNRHHGVDHQSNQAIMKGCDLSVTSDLTSPSFDEKRYSRLQGSDPPKFVGNGPGVKHPQIAPVVRSQPSQKSVDTGPTHCGGRSIISNHSSSTGGGSIMSTQSYLTLSAKIRTLIELAADVVNSENLVTATTHYQKAIHSAGSEIMSINIQMGNMLVEDNSANVAARNSCHEDLRLIGIIIGMLRTKMAILNSDVGEYERAIDLCKGAVQVHRHQPVLKSISNSLSDTDDVVGLMVLIIERLESAQAMFEAYRELHDKTDPKLYDDAIEVLSIHTAKKDKHDEGVMFLRDALQIHLVALGLKHPHTSKSLLHVARMYRGSGNDRNNERLVLGYFQQTAAVLQRSNLNHQSRVSILNDIAVIHMRRKMFDESIKFLLDALHAFDEIEMDDQSKRGKHIGTLQIWRNLGECYMQLFKFKSAEGAFLKALHIQRDCVKIHEAAERLDINALKVNESTLSLSNDTAIADTICQIGKARAGGGNPKQALDIYREALRVLNRNSTADHDRTDEELLKKRDQLTHLLFCIAEAERSDDEIEKALQMYHLSLRLRRSHGSEYVDKRKTTSIHCLSCFLGIIDIYIRQKKFQEAKNEIKSAMDYRVQTRVKQTHPVVLAIRKKAKDCQLAITDAAMRNPDIDALEKKADTEIERGALDMAIETLRRLLIIRRAALKELKEQGQDTRDQVYAIACLLQTFGFVFAKNGDDENSERAFKDASRLFRKGGIPNEPSPNHPNLVQL